MRRPLAAMAAALALAGCAESSSEVNTPGAWDSVQANPALIRGAEQALADAPPPAEGWRVGVVLAESTGDHDWTVSILTGDGMAAIQESWGCDDVHDQYGGYAYEVLALWVDPGDLITWSLQGGDAEVCPSELQMLQKGAAREVSGDAG